MTKITPDHLARSAFVYVRPADAFREDEERTTCSQERRQLCAMAGYFLPQKPASNSSRALRPACILVIAVLWVAFL